MTTVFWKYKNVKSTKTEDSLPENQQLAENSLPENQQIAENSLPEHYHLDITWASLGHQHKSENSVGNVFMF